MGNMEMPVRPGKITDNTLVTGSSNMVNPNMVNSRDMTTIRWASTDTIHTANMDNTGSTGKHRIMVSNRERLHHPDPGAEPEDRQQIRRLAKPNLKLNLSSHKRRLPICKFRAVRTLPPPTEFFSSRDPS
jgi:hypothetical protein